MRGTRVKRGVCFLALFGTLCGILRAETSIYSGFLGCRYSPSVCLQDEHCVDDMLFGVCLSGLSQGEAPYQYNLDRAQLQLLEYEVSSLIKVGYTWQDLYTQCVLGNVLLSFRRGVAFDPAFCDRDAPREALQDELSADARNLLQKYFQDYYDDLMEAESRPRGLDLGNDIIDVDKSAEPLDLEKFATKKDEMTYIHKYLNNKRDPWMSEEEEEGEEPNAWRAEPDRYEVEPDPWRAEPDQFSEEYPQNVDESPILPSEYDSFLENLSPEEVAILREHLSRPEGGSEYIAEPTEIDQPVEGGDYGVVRQPPGGGQEYYYDDPNIASDTDSFAEMEDSAALPSNMAAPMELEEQTSAAKQRLGPMSQDDAKTLQDLLQGSVKVSSLSDKQINRLTDYVDAMIDSLDSMSPEQKRLLQGVIAQNLPASSEVLAGDDNDDDGVGADAAVVVRQIVVKKEQMNGEVVKSPEGKGDTSVHLAPNHLRPAPSDAPPESARPVALSRDLVQADIGKVVGGDAEADPHDHSWDTAGGSIPTAQPPFSLLDVSFVFVKVEPKTNNLHKARHLVSKLETVLHLPSHTFSEVRVQNGMINFHVDSASLMNASMVAEAALKHSDHLQNQTQLLITESGLGRDETKVNVLEVNSNGPKYFVLTFVLCGVIAGIVLAVIAIYVVRRHSQSKEKLAQLASTSTDGTEASKDYQDLCRQRMQSKSSEKPEPLHVASRVGSVSAAESAVRSPSSRSSTSSWSEEPVTSNMDISTGHIVLSYMEDHLQNKDRLDQEWEALCAYEAEPNSGDMATQASNMRKNRYTDILPYDHSRVVLSTATNVSGSDYINASSITDHDPRNPAYIATQGPLPHTVADFWQMVWEQGSVIIVDLTKLTENGVSMCHRYWPEEGSDLYHIYEVHLVSEHIWCDDYLVRSFYLKNLQTNETRTVTQFHFLTWTDLGVPSSAKALLEFRRKVNKSYRGRSCPVIVQCSDGSGRSGTYTLIDMVLNRMSKGAKEIDIAATLEHIRDQRMQMVKTKEQFEFALASVAEEVHAILKALPQQ